MFGTAGTLINGGTGTTITTHTSSTPYIATTSNLGLSQAVINQNNMNRQVKVAVFTVERNKDNKVTSSTFVKELWVEVKNGASLELSVAKELDKDFDPANTIIKELYSFIF